MSDTEKAVLCCWFFVLVFVSGFAVGCSCTNKRNQQDLVERGIAEWVVDKEGNVEFKFKEAKP